MKQCDEKIYSAIVSDLLLQIYTTWQVLVGFPYSSKLVVRGKFI